MVQSNLAHLRTRLNRIEARLGRRSKYSGHRGPGRPVDPKYEALRIWTKPTLEYQNDFLGYCKSRGWTLTPQQAKVGETLVQHKRTLVPSGNSLGKSWLAAALASWHYDCWPAGETFVTAPNLKQVKDIVFKELRLLRPGDPNFYKRAARLQSSPNHFIDGLTARTATGFQGRHDVSVMVIFDEAEDIPVEFWRSAETMAHFWVAIYNPTTTGSQAAIEERSGHWPIVPLNALEHPNIAAELSGRPPLIPSAVRLSEVRNRLKKWSRVIRPDERRDTDVEFEGILYRPGPAAEARVLGRRPTSSVDTVFSKELWDKLVGTKHELDISWPWQIGCDVARFGDDFSVVHGRKGYCSLVHESVNGFNTVAVAKMVEKVCYDLSPSHQCLIPIMVDDTGVGGGVTDILQARGFNAIAVNAACKGDFPEEYPNIRSEMQFSLADIIDKGLCDISRLPVEFHEDLFKQMMAPKYSLDTHGRRVVEPKAVTKANISRSPDDLDAMCLAYLAAPTNHERYV